MDPLSIILLAIIGFATSFIATNTGGGALISIPALIFMGLPAQVAIATSRMGSIGQVLSGLYAFHEEKKVDFKIGIPIAIIALIGSFFGSNLLIEIPNALLQKLVAVFIIIVVVILALNPKIGVKKVLGKSTLHKTVGYVSFFFVGFWAGLFGGGAGTFASYVLIFFFGQTFIESAGTRKMAGLAMVSISLAIFLINGLVQIIPGFVLMSGMVIGSYFGSKYGIKQGNKWIRTLFIIIVIASALKLLV